jgi:hypothetical protein
VVILLGILVGIEATSDSPPLLVKHDESCIGIEGKLLYSVSEEGPPAIEAGRCG